VNPIVLDASVVASAFLPEAHSDAARAVLLAGHSLHAPELLYAEVANVIWKRSRRGEVSPEEAEALLSDILDLPIETVAIEELSPAALQLAIRTKQTVYDCLYLALAVRMKTTVISGDQRLVNALAGTPLEAHVEWIGKRG
jgi:predicted nucleic acid-binding protein